MTNSKTWPTVGYILILLFGGLYQLLRPRQIEAFASYELFSTPPPKITIQSSKEELRSNLSPVNEVIIEPGGNMILAHVNKTFGLPSDYLPSNLAAVSGVPTVGTQRLRSEVLPYLYQLFGAASQAGFDLAVLSSYRSYFYQEEVFLEWVAAVGWEEAVFGSAYPGHSEHQLGTTLDLTLNSQNNDDFETFSQSPASLWVAQNAHKFGFVVSYPPGKEHITGYMHEPWHIRWIGVDLATFLYQKGLTLEEYLSN